MKFSLLISLTLCCGGGAHAGLVSWWPLDGSPADAAGTNAGLWNGTAVYTTPAAAPGSTQAADCSNATVPKRFLRAGTGIDFAHTQAFSATAWIKGGAQDSTIVGDMLQGGTYRGWEMHVGTAANGGSSTGLTIWLLNTYPSNAIQVSSPVNVLTGTWRHVAFTYDGSRTGGGVKVYVDGAPASASVTLSSLTDTIANGTGAELNIGTRQNGANHTFTGGIDEVAVFDHALSAAEVSQIYTGGIGSLTTPPVMASTDPRQGETVLSLTTADVVFTRDVTGVNAADLLINGTPAQSVSALTGGGWRFTFTQPAAGTVNFTWVAGHGIQDAQGQAFPGTGWSVVLDPAAPVPAVHISEFLTENAGGFEDEDHATPDWIEITNPGPARMDLAGWSLTDDAASPQKWVFPSTVLHSGDRVVVFASGKNRAVSGAPLHAGFRLAENGGHLSLHRPDGTAAHVIDNYPPQEANVSFGPQPGALLSEGAGAWRYFFTPTPGAAGAVSPLPAAVRSVTHSPAWPGDNDDVTVTALVNPVPGPVTGVTLFYRVQEGAEIPLSMTAGPAGWSAVIPAAAAGPGQMIRWRVEAIAGGLVSRWPLNDSAARALPLYLGTTVRDASVATALPLYEVFVAGYSRPPSAGGPYHAADSDGGARGTFAWQGVLYDNVLFRIKGTTSRYLYKRSHRVEFNPGRGFQWDALQPPLRELNLNSEYTDPAYCRQYLSLWMQRESGGGGAPHFPVRVHMNGDFWQLAFHTMAADRELLSFMGLDDRGALYKQVGQLTAALPEKENRTWESSADYTAFAAGISESRTLAQRTAALMDSADIAAVINYIAVARLTQEADDVWANMVLFRDSEDSLLWRPVPFDLNLSFGQLFHDGQPWNTVVHATMDNNKSHPLYGSSVCRPQYPSNPAYNSWWNRLYDAVIQNPDTRAMLLRRMRTLMDRFYAPPGTPYGQRPLETELDALWARIQPEAVLDRNQWGWPPVNNTIGSFGVYGLGNVPPAQAVNDVKTLYLDPRRTHLYITHSVTNTAVATGITNTANAGIPEAQPPAPALAFGTIEASPASGNQDEEIIQIINPNGYAVDVSGWHLSGGVSDTFDAGTVIPAGASLYLTPSVAAFRLRAVSPRGGESRQVQGDYNGHLSNFGETLVITRPDGSIAATATYSGTPSPLQQWLAISELAYAPAPDGAAEFIELVNRSPVLTLDLTGAHFTAGVDFNFTGSAITSLAPGQRVLIVRNLTAFQTAYGPGLPVAGVFANNTRLDNAGERLKLEDALNNTIFDFTYGTTAPWPAEGVMVFTGPQPDVSASANWRLPAVPGGGPGTADRLTFSGSTPDDLTAYATGGDPQFTLTMEVLPGETNPVPVLTFAHALGADAARAVPELSPTLTDWDPAVLQPLGMTRIGSSTRALLRFRATGSAAEWPRVFGRVRFESVP